MSYCEDCPDREACHQGTPCDLSKKFAAVAKMYNEKMRGIPMSNNTAKTSNVTAADVVAEAKEKKLVTEVPAQGNTEDKTTGEKAKEVVEETAEATKKTVKNRLSDLAAKAKKNKQFFLGVVTGVVGTATVMLATATKVEEVVEVTVEEEPVVEGGTTESGV